MEGTVTLESSDQTAICDFCCPLQLDLKVFEPQNDETHKQGSMSG